MPFALVADADARERMRCIRTIASQTSVSAVGVGTWEELEASIDGGPPLSLIIYSGPLVGEPENVSHRLQMVSQRVVITTTGELPPPSLGRGPTWMKRPIPEETLILLARASGSLSARHKVSFAPVDFLQMICMSGDSHMLILNNGKADTGVIEVRDGKVWTAYDSLGVGEDAFARLVRPEMRARVRPAADTPKQRTIHKELSELLLDSLRRIDEGSVPPPPSLSSTELEDLVASPDVIAERIKTITTEARKHLMSRNYDEAARLLLKLKELDPTSVLVRANLEQLRKLGYPR
ncbi:MAG: DUF4388 domain-containing protein [Polyangiaceae bacterium]|nr:DUF4388 domain-containing protein [Polyangiaceae bacterium]